MNSFILFGTAFTLSIYFPPFFFFCDSFASFNFSSSNSKAFCFRRHVGVLENQAVTLNSKFKPAKSLTPAIPRATRYDKPRNASSSSRYTGSLKLNAFTNSACVKG